MKPIHLSLLIICLGSLFLNSCTATRQLSNHKTTLQRLAYGDMSPQEKFDGLANTMTTVMDESLRIVNPTKTYNYLDKFSQQNETALNSLYDELNSWREGMKRPQKIAFSARTLAKPYTRRLANLAGKLKKRIGSRLTQLSLLMQISNLLKVKKRS